MAKKKKARLEINKDMLFLGGNPLDSDGYSYLSEIESIQNALPSVTSLLKEYESSNKISDRRLPVLQAMNEKICVIADKIAAISKYLPDDKLDLLDSLLYENKELFEMKGSHNQWVIDEPFVSTYEEQTHKKVVKKTKENWELFGYPKLTGLCIAENFYSVDENKNVRLGQVTRLIVELLEKENKPSISVESLKSFLKDSLNIPEEASSKGIKRLSKQYKEGFFEKYQSFLDNEHNKNIAIFFNNLQ